MTRPRPLGRRPGDPADTRRAILAASRRRFGAVGFERATIRSIATEADVDPALVIHHFGSKQGLFVAAHELPVNPAALIETLLKTPRDRRGMLLAQALLAAMTAPASPMVSLLRSAATNDDAARMLREFINSAVLSRADEIVDLPDARLRLALIGSHVVGMAFATVIVGVPDLLEREIGDLADHLAPVLQRYLTDGDLFGT